MKRHKHFFNTLYGIHQYIRVGYTEYGMYFYIISLSAIIGGFFNLAGVGAFVMTLLLFYWAGKAHKKVTEKVSQPP